MKKLTLGLLVAGLCALALAVGPVPGSAAGARYDAFPLYDGDGDILAWDCIGRCSGATKYCCEIGFH